MKRGSTIRPDTARRHVGKYKNANLFHRLVLNRFFDQIAQEIKEQRPGKVLDVGCGEGLFWQEMKLQGVHIPSLLGIDLRDEALEAARQLLPRHTFERRDLLAWDTEQKFDLVIASQVLEHLHEPGEFIARMSSLTNGKLLLTVPWEPWFRLANLARGRDIARLGNHPEHVQLWGVRKFESLVSRYATIEKSIRIFPFLMIVATAN